MARIQMGVIVTDIRGKLAGNQFSKTRAGNILQRKCGQRKGASPAQSTRRGVFAEFSRYWRTLTDGERLANNTNTSSYPILDKFGNTTYLSGYQLLLRSNINLNTIEASPINVVPGTPPAGAGLVLTNSEITITAGVITTASQAWLTPTGDFANKTYVLYVSPGVSQGVSIYNGRYIIFGPGDPSDQLVEFDIMFGSILATPAAGDKIFIIIDLVDTATGIVVNSYSNSIIVSAFSFDLNVTLTSGVSYNIFALFSDGSTSVPAGMELLVYLSNGAVPAPIDFENLAYALNNTVNAGSSTNPATTATGHTTGVNNYIWWKVVLRDVNTLVVIDTNYFLTFYA